MCQERTRSGHPIRITTPWVRPEVVRSWVFASHQMFRRTRLPVTPKNTVGTCLSYIRGPGTCCAILKCPSPLAIPRAFLVWSNNICWPLEDLSGHTKALLEKQSTSDLSSSCSQHVDSSMRRRRAPMQVRLCDGADSKGLTSWC